MPATATWRRIEYIYVTYFFVHTHTHTRQYSSCSKILIGTNLQLQLLWNMPERKTKTRWCKRVPNHLHWTYETRMEQNSKIWKYTMFVQENNCHVFAREIRSQRWKKDKNGISRTVYRCRWWRAYQTATSRRYEFMRHNNESSLIKFHWNYYVGGPKQFTMAM